MCRFVREIGKYSSTLLSNAGKYTCTDNSMLRHFLFSSVIFSLGKVLVLPCIDKWYKVDMRMRAFSVPPQMVKVIGVIYPVR